MLIFFSWVSFYYFALLATKCFYLLRQRGGHIFWVRNGGKVGCRLILVSKHRPPCTHSDAMRGKRRGCGIAADTQSVQEMCT